MFTGKTLLTALTLWVSLLLAFQAGAQSQKEVDRLRKMVFDHYSAGNYDEAMPLAKELLSKDLKCQIWMDYFIMADIYLRREAVDSARGVVELGVERTTNIADSLVRKRNNDVWNNLRRQLKNQRDYLVIPKFRPLEEYAEYKPDSAKAKTDEGFGALSPFSIITSMPELLAAPLKQPEDSAEIRFNTPPALVGGFAAINRYIDERKLFPDSAIAAGVGLGAVIADVTVDTSGKASEVEIFLSHPIGLGFEELAREALLAMGYKPAYGDTSKVIGALMQAALFKNETVLRLNAETAVKDSAGVETNTEEKSEETQTGGEAEEQK